MSRNYFWISSQRLLIAISICSCANSILSLKSSFTSLAFLALSFPFPHAYLWRSITSYLCTHLRGESKQCDELSISSLWPFSALILFWMNLSSRCNCNYDKISLTFHAKVANIHTFFTLYLQWDRNSQIINCCTSGARQLSHYNTIFCHHLTLPLS